MTAADVPGERFQGHIVHDWPAMIAVGEETRYVGDAIALVAAETRDAAKEAAEKIKLDYEVLPPLVDPKQALDEDAPKLHPKGNLLAQRPPKRGDPDKAIAEAAHRRPQDVPDARDRARLHGAGERPRHPGEGRDAHRLHRDPEHLRRLARHHRRPRPAAGEGEGRQRLVGRRLRRQGGPHRPAPRRAARLEPDGPPVKVTLDRQERSASTPSATPWTWTSSWPPTPRGASPA